MFGFRLQTHTYNDEVCFRDAKMKAKKNKEKYSSTHTIKASDARKHFHFKSEMFLFSFTKRGSFSLLLSQTLSNVKDFARISFNFLATRDLFFFLLFLLFLLVNVFPELPTFKHYRHRCRRERCFPVIDSQHQKFEHVLHVPKNG